MNKLNKILGVLVAVQLALALFVLLRSDSTKASKPQPILAGFDPVGVTRLQIFEAGSDEGGPEKSVDLVKQGPSWVLASQWGYPVDNAKLDAALAPLGKLVAGDPITTSTAKHKQLRVGDKDFDKKLVITAGGKDTTLLIGATKGKSTPVRLAGDDRVLGASGVPTGALSATARDWVSANYSEIPRDDIDKILIERGAEKFEVDRTTTTPPADAGSGSAAPAPRPWRVAIGGAPVTLAAGETINDFSIETLLSSTSTITADPADPKLDASKPTATVTVTKRDGKTVVFDLVASNLTVWVKQRGLERATSLDKTRLESILTYDRSQLVEKPKPSPDAGSGIKLPGMGQPPIVPPPGGLP